MVDQDKIREAVKLMLEGIGENADREGLLDTPDRIARIWTGMRQSIFPECLR